MYKSKLTKLINSLIDSPIAKARCWCSMSYAQCPMPDADNWYRSICNKQT